MIAGFLITFRETLEAVLVVGIVLAYLVKTNQPGYRKFVWWGILFGILVSIAGALILTALLGGLSGRTEEIFEGVLMFIAAGLIAHGVHEFQEAGVLPVFIENVWDINWLVDEKGTFGSILKALFGYNGNPCQYSSN